MYLSTGISFDVRFLSWGFGWFVVSFTEEVSCLPLVVKNGTVSWPDTNCVMQCYFCLQSMYVRHNGWKWMLATFWYLSAVDSCSGHFNTNNWLYMTIWNSFSLIKILAKIGYFNVLKLHQMFYLFCRESRPRFSSFKQLAENGSFPLINQENLHSS